MHSLIGSSVFISVELKYVMGCELESIVYLRRCWSWRLNTPKGTLCKPSHTESLSSFKPFSVFTRLMDRKLNRIPMSGAFSFLAHSLPNQKGGGEHGMKRLVLSILCLVALTLTAIPASAQTRT